MSDLPNKKFNPGTYGHTAIIVTFAVAYLSTAVAIGNQFSFLTWLILILLGLISILFSIPLDKLFIADNKPWKIAVFYLLQLSIIGVINYIGQGQFWLLFLPLASMAVSVQSRRATAVIVVVITLLFLLPFFGAGPAVIIQWALIFGCALVFVLLFTEVTVRSQLARMEVERLARELEEANRRLREYAAQAEELARTRERNRLAREIHDSLGHYLTVVNVQLEAARTLLENRGWEKTAPELNAALEKAQTLTRDGLADVRRSVAALRANPIGEKPLLEAINALAEQLREAGLVTTLEFEGDASRLTPQIETALYRTVQEALTNIRKHARASQVNIQLAVGTRTVTVEVRDNGIGMAEENAEENKFGLIGLRERAELLHGLFEVGAAPEGGVRLALELPLEPAPKPPLT